MCVVGHRLLQLGEASAVKIATDITLTVVVKGHILPEKIASPWKHALAKCPPDYILIGKHWVLGALHKRIAAEKRQLKSKRKNARLWMGTN